MTKALSSSHPFAFCDVGSNAVRLEVYRDLTRVPEVLASEKALCGLGQGLATTGLLDGAGRAQALAALSGYVARARKLKAEPIEIICTEAVRAAKDGKDFLREVTQKTGVTPRVLSGAREARLAAAGVLMGMPRVDGVAGDLGGGSLELMNLEAGRLRDFVSLPVGTLRTLSTAALRKELAALPWLADALKGRRFIAGGGSWRNLARLYIRTTKYPIDIVDALALDAADFARFCKTVAAYGPIELKKAGRLLDRKLEDLPVAAERLALILTHFRPAEIVFTAGGVREGAFYTKLPAAVRRQDPLITVARRLAGSKANDLCLSGDRLMIAALLLSMVAWGADRDPVLAVLNLPVPGLPHGERVFLALVMAKSLGLRKLPPALKTCVGWMDAEDVEMAEALGMALAEND